MTVLLIRTGLSTAQCVSYHPTDVYDDSFDPEGRVMFLLECLANSSVVQA
ncbi:hypothetical protein F2Q69_00001769 [Brassica cretica]|uniref:Uncharacterized protein n=1 Tax=Brassica cretica TaxID=69181 RepID=A0A8S9NXL0_BRACR|nr:hypothetical protein F2Q69_00001769 [Brassica cretica]